MNLIANVTWLLMRQDKNMEKIGRKYRYCLTKKTPYLHIGIPLYTMAAFENFCPKIIWDKSQFQVPTNKKSEKIKALLLCQF